MQRAGWIGVMMGGGCRQGLNNTAAAGDPSEEPPPAAACAPNRPRTQTIQRAPPCRRCTRRKLRFRLLVEMAGHSRRKFERGEGRSER